MKKIYPAFILLFLLLSGSVFMTPAFGQPGAIDPTFNPTDLGFGNGDGANSPINTTAIQSDGKIIIGGEFTSYNATTRNKIARLNSNGTLDETFNSGTGADNSIKTIAIQSDGKIIVGGDFTTYNGMTLNGVARLNSNGTLDVAFTPGTGASGTVLTTAIQSDGKIIIGGDFTDYDGTTLNGIARLESDGTLDVAFTQGTGAIGTVFTTSIQSDGKIIIGGEFSAYNGTTRNRIARLNSDGSLDVTFIPGTGANSTINTIAIQSDGKIIIGGEFTSYNGTTKNRIARLNSAGSLDVTFNSGTGTNGSIYTTTIQSDGKIIIGGFFTSYNGTTINRIARLNVNGTLDVAFTPGTGASSAIFTITVQSDDKIIIGGFFTSYNEKTRNRIARLNSEGLLDATFNPATGANSTINSTTIQSDGKIIIGGEFTAYNGTPSNRIARLNSDGTLDATFSIGMGTNSTILTTAIQSDGKIIIGGFFTFYDVNSRNSITRLNSDGTLDATFNTGTGANSAIYTIAIQSDGKIIIGGAFSLYNGTARNRIARLNSNGTLDATFNPGTGPNSTIQTTSIQSDGKIIIGGQFTTYNGTTRNRIARLNSDGTLDVSFNPGTGANSTILTTAIKSDGKIIIAGAFNTYNGTGRNSIARLNSDGTLDATFNPGTGANNTIQTTTIQSDGKIIIGGEFTDYNGTARNRIARLNSDGTLDATFTPGTGANNTINTAAIQSDGNIIIGGGFTAYDGTGRNRVARILAAGSVVPLKLLSFSGIHSNNGNLLQWQTANEVGTKNFIIEKSSTGSNFTNIATVAAQRSGAANYSYLDNSTQSEVVFYRLKMVDVDGSFTYSNIIKLSVDNTVKVEVFPNPVTDFITVSVSRSSINKNAVLINMQGIQLQRIKISRQAFTLNLANYPNGIYLLKIEGAEVKKIVKQ
jgi:uncharacterized delta-60 repeat protein